MINIKKCSIFHSSKICKAFWRKWVKTVDIDKHWKKLFSEKILQQTKTVKKKDRFETTEKKYLIDPFQGYYNHFLQNDDSDDICAIHYF